MSIPPIEFMVEIQPGTRWYRARWHDDYGPDGIFLDHIEESCVDLIPFVLARKLMEQGYNLDRVLVVGLAGADYRLMRAPLGVVAATPLLNPKPVTHPIQFMYRDKSRYV